MISFVPLFIEINYDENSLDCSFKSHYIIVVSFVGAAATTIISFHFTIITKKFTIIITSNFRFHYLVFSFN